MQAAFHTIVRHCEHCGQQLKLNNSRDIARKKCCSPSCRQKARWARGEQSIVAAMAKAQDVAQTADKLCRQERYCEKCHDPFFPTGNRQRWCSTCCPNKGWRNKLQRYGVSKPEFDLMLAAQGGGCALCGSPNATIIDHDHSCCASDLTCGRCVRGILCGSCNLLLAGLEQHPEWLKAAADYLAKGKDRATKKSSTKKVDVRRRSA